MANWDDVRRIVLRLPETSERQSGDVPQWRVKDKLLAWERPLRGVDLEALGDQAPADPPLAARVPDVGAREALIADAGDVYFTTPHFEGYPVVLVRLDRIDVSELEELLTEAWLSRAPKSLARAFLESSP
ncbi:MAG TPA: MmcQ/YjbR family DNA-binding protein [Nocardioidaceae bacterium]|nr:MmcQ/YjbR family DNA-binding protein [Nocardioidaceae bacterium]